MKPLFGATRSTVTPHYALLTPEGLVPSVRPGWEHTTCLIVIAPALGAHFTQTLATLTPESRVVGNTLANEMFLFVISGNVQLQASGKTLHEQQQHQVPAGGYSYLPVDHAYHIRSSVGETRLLIFERPYNLLAGVPPLEPLIGQEQDVVAEPFMGDEAAMLKTLLPDQPGFDMAVNIFTFAPGATLPMVETHIMEHGLLMLQGQGIYRLGNDWHPVRAGDSIWMASYCPQWFVAMGKTPARYIYYKDVNREPLLT